MPQRTYRNSRSRAATHVVERTPARDDRDVEPEKLAGYPSLRMAAKILGVDPGTLSRRTDVQREGVRRGNALVLPTELTLRLALHYRRRRSSEVASDLLDLAVERAPEYVDAIEAEIDAVQTRAHRYESPRRDAEIFLREAKRALPPELYGQVVAAYTSGQGVTPGSPYRGDDD